MRLRVVQDACGGVGVLIYAGNPDGVAVDECRRLGVGVMIATSTGTRTNKRWRGMRCALDNGGYRCARRGYPFMAQAFRDQMWACYKAGLDLDFIVAPDIVGAGRRSLTLSMEWAVGELATAPHVAVPVHAGMTPAHLVDVGGLARFSHVFIGLGSVNNDWAVVSEWIEFAHQYGKHAHVGQVGTLGNLRAAEHLGADSVDSTNFARNGAWKVIETFCDDPQLELPEVTCGT